jgi:hypothetical protein
MANSFIWPENVISPLPGGKLRIIGVDPDSEKGEAIVPSAPEGTNYTEVPTIIRLTEPSGKPILQGKKPRRSQARSGGAGTEKRPYRTNASD